MPASIQRQLNFAPDSRESLQMDTGRPDDVTVLVSSKYLKIGSAAVGFLFSSFIISKASITLWGGR